MLKKSFQLGAFLIALVLAFMVCVGGINRAAPSEAEEQAADIGGSALQTQKLLYTPDSEARSRAGLAAETEPAPEPTPEPQPQPRLTQADIDQALEQVMEDYSAAGVTVATVECGQLSQSGAWGWAVKKEREMTPDTKIRIASISKVVVAMCAMAMAEDGLLDLDAPISDYWGSKAVNPYSKTQPTVQDFMTHTSSLKTLELTRGLSNLRSILQSKSSWRSMEPGSGGYWHYSNFGISVLGTTLELAADQVLDDYLQTRLLEPIGAEASFFGGRLDEDELANLYHPSSMGLAISGQRAGPYTEIGRSAALFPGNFTVSAVDMAKLVSVLVNDGVYLEPVYEEISVTDEETGETGIAVQPVEGQFNEIRLLTEASVENMETPRFLMDQEGYVPFEQCLILRRQEDVLGQEVLYYHTGSAYGVFSLMTYNPETKNGVVVITTGTPRNQNEHGMYALCYDLMEILYEKMEAEPA